MVTRSNLIQRTSRSFGIDFQLKGFLRGPDEFRNTTINIEIEMKQTLLNLVAALSLASVAFADQTPDHKVLVLKNKDGAAILGYDAVAYFTDNKPAKGNPKFQSEYEGVKYFFASAEHKVLFDANPAKYEPQYGGYCAFAVAKKGTTTRYTGAVSGGPNKTVQLSALVTDATGTPLANRTVQFQLGAQSASATTNASGIAATSLKLNQKNGTYTVSATFTPVNAAPNPLDGDHYLGSSQSTIFKLQAK